MQGKNFTILINIPNLGPSVLPLLILVQRAIQELKGSTRLNLSQYLR